MKRTLAAFDPGKEGGIAIGLDPSDLIAFSMPMAGNELDLALLRSLLFDNGVEKAFVEKVGAMPGQGVVSMFTFGCGYGGILGVLAGLSIPTELVTPQRWKKEVLSGTTKDKDAAVEYCRRVFPNVPLLASTRSRKPHSGIADALCIWEFGRRMANTPLIA